MNILVVNDDGPTPLLQAFVQALEKLGHTVSAVVPDCDCSGSGGAICLDVARYWHVKNNIHCLGGKPADCTCLGIQLFDPELVISGPNQGYNPAACANLSGTINAAGRARALGVRAMAVSIDRTPVADVAVAATHIANTIQPAIVAGPREFISANVLLTTTELRLVTPTPHVPKLAIDPATCTVWYDWDAYWAIDNEVSIAAREGYGTVTYL